MEKQLPGWKWLERLDTIWSLFERFGYLFGLVLMIGAAPASILLLSDARILAGVIPMVALGFCLFMLGNRRRARIESVRDTGSYPIKSEFIKERIHILALLDPTGTVRNKTFIDCEVFGPAVLCPTGSNVNISQPQIFARFEESSFVPLADGAKHPDGAVGLDNCFFNRCSFYRITFALGKENMEHIKKTMTLPDGSPLSSVGQQPNASNVK